MRKLESFITNGMRQIPPQEVPRVFVLKEQINGRVGTFLPMTFLTFRYLVA